MRISAIGGEGVCPSRRQLADRPALPSAIDRTVRTGILAWSAASGAVIGLVLAGLLIGLGAVVLALAPGLAARLGPRWTQGMAVAVLVALPAVGAVLGYLEGRLKLD